MDKKLNEFVGKSLVVTTLFGFGAGVATAQDAPVQVPAPAPIQGEPTPGVSVDVNAVRIDDAKKKLRYYARHYCDITQCKLSAEHLEILIEEFDLRVKTYVKECEQQGRPVSMVKIIDKAFDDSWKSFLAVHNGVGIVR